MINLIYREGKEESEREEPADLSQKIVFKKRGSKNIEVRAPEKNLERKNSNEQIEKQTGDKKDEQMKSSKSKAKSTQLTLSHLDEEEDE